MELPDADAFYDSDGAGPCTQAPWEPPPSPLEDAPPDGSDSCKGGNVFSASHPPVASQATFDFLEGVSDAGQLDEADGPADKRACKLASLADLLNVGGAAVLETQSGGGCSRTWAPPELQRLGGLVTQPATQNVTPDDHLPEDGSDEKETLRSKRSGSPDSAGTSHLSIGVRGAGAKTVLGEKQKTLCARLPSGDLSSGGETRRRGGESLEGMILAVSPVIEIGAASKPGQEQLSFFLLELKLLESAAVTFRAVGQVATAGSVCWSPGAESEAGRLLGGWASADGCREQPAALKLPARVQLTSVERSRTPKLAQPQALTSASQRAFLYFEGATGSEWREVCAKYAGQSVRFTGLKRRTMVVGSQGTERLVYVPGSNFGMDSGGRDHTVFVPSGGAGCERAEAADGGAGCSLRGGGARQTASREGGEGAVQHGGVRQGAERPPQEQSALPENQRDQHCGGGPSDGQRTSEVREAKKGLPHNGTLCYVGVVTAVWSSGLVVELDRKLNLLLTHYPATGLPGLRVGSLLATWHVHPILRGSRVHALGACTHSLVTVLGSPNPTGSESGLAGRGHVLRQLCDRLPFSVAFWAVELKRSLRVKLGADSDGSVPAAARRDSRELRPVRETIKSPSRGPDGFRVALGGEAARSDTAPNAAAQQKAKNGWKPSLRSLTQFQTASVSEGSGAPRLAARARNGCGSPVREVLTHLLPGWEELRQRRDVFQEFMSHDTECGLGVDPVGWRTPPKVPPIAALLKEIRDRGQESGLGLGRLTGEELGTALLGYLQVATDSGRAVLADATGSVRIEVRGRLEAVHLGRWLLVTKFTADVRATSDLGPDCSEPFISFSLADALLVTAPPPPASAHEKPLKSSHKTSAVPIAYGRGTWPRPGDREGAQTAAARGVDAATWQSEGRTAWQPLDGRGNTGCTTAGGSSKQAGGTPFWMISIVSKSALVRGERGLRFAAEVVLLPRALRLLDPERGPDGGALTSAQKSGGGSVSSGGFRFPQNPANWRSNPQNPKPRSGLVQSYHRAVANEVRQNSGPPWLVGRAETSQTLAVSSDGCLLTPAWERSHQPIHTALTRSLDRCTGGPKQAALRGGSPLDGGGVPEERRRREPFHPGATFSVVPNPVGANRVSGAALTGHTVQNGFRSSGPCPSSRATGESRRMDPWSRYGAPGLGHRTVTGAAAAARMAGVRPPKRPKVSGTEFPVKRAESGGCVVYSQRLGATGRADQELERGSPTSGVLEENEPLGRSRSAAGPEARAVLTFAGKAALSYDWLHAGSTYLVPAPLLPSEQLESASTSTAPALPPRKYSQPSLPVIDLADRNSVHCVSFVSRRKAATDAEKGEPSSPPTTRRIAETGNGFQASRLVEVPEPVYRELLPFSGASLCADRPEDRARGAGGDCGAVETVRLRGRVVGVLELQLVWGCPFCGALSLPVPDARTLRSGCVRCCADGSQCTVLLREACFSFDDGASQCEVWAEGSAAADLLSLPYVPADPLVCPPYVPANSLPANQRSVGRVAIFHSKSNIGIPVRSSGNDRSLAQPSQEPSSTVQGYATALESATAIGLSNPSRFAPRVSSSPRQQAAAVTSPSAHGVKRLRTTSPDSARESLLESVKSRQGTSRAARYEPATLFGHLHRCLLDPSKLEALVRREGLVRLKANPEGAADGSFQAAQREMTGEGTGQLSGPDREVLEVLLGSASRQSQKVLTCARLPRSSADRSRFLSREQSEASRSGRCRVYLSGQVYEIHAPVVAAYRVLMVEPVSPSVEAEALCRQLTVDVTV